MSVDNSEDLKEAKSLSRELNDDIEYRTNIVNVLVTLPKLQNLVNEDYFLKLTLLIGKKNRIKIMNED
jgi:hypothetical protein